MTDSKKSPDALIADLLDSGIELPPMPAIGAELLAVARQPVDTVDVKKVTALIESDPSVAARILRMANSPYFGVANEVTSLRQGIVLIGLAETINTLYFYVLMKTLPRFPSVEGFSSEDYWAHSWACATAGRMLGRPQFLIRSLPGELYLAGLLHGVGKLVLAMTRKDEFARCVALAREQNIPLHQAEEGVLGFHHLALGARLLKSWNLPPSIRAAVGFYHSPGEADPRYQEIAALTQLAYLIANQSGIGYSGSPCENDPSQAWIVAQGSGPLSNRATLDPLVAEIADTLKKKSALMAAVGSSDEAVAPKEAPPSAAGRQEKRPIEAPAATPPARKEKKGFWARLLDVFRS